MTSCILGCQYIPSVEYFAHWMHHGSISIESHEHYQKRTWRNKTAILGPNAPVMLTVPLRKGKNQEKMITDVLIAYDDPWHYHHLNAIKTSYGKTAFFDEIISGLENIFHSKPQVLWELNLNLIQYIITLLPGDWPFEMTEDFFHSYPSTISDFRFGVPAGKSLSGTGSTISYVQIQRLHKSYQPNLSILDALCHLGPDTHSFLARYAGLLYEYQR